MCYHVCVEGREQPEIVSSQYVSQESNSGLVPTAFNWLIHLTVLYSGEGVCEIGSCYVPLTGLELPIFLPPPPLYWDNLYKPPPKLPFYSILIVYQYYIHWDCRCGWKDQVTLALSPCAQKSSEAVAEAQELLCHLTGEDSVEVNVYNFLLSIASHLITENRP